VEVVVPDGDVEPARPGVLDALENERSTGDELLDAVGAAAERRLERGRRDVTFPAGPVAPFPPMLGHHLQLADDLRQLPVAGSGEMKGEVVVAGLLDLGDVPVIG